ncbi:MAG: VWA domain-containing protein [Actinobacteria bacterium]|nr:VWA domain-containing protein [Actinomycetota bacterium]
MIGQVLTFTAALRRAGVPVGTSENLDALRSLEHVDLQERETFRAALAATMIKSDAHRPTFDVLFDLYFAPLASADEAEQERSEPSADDAERFLGELFGAMAGGDGRAVDELARRAIGTFGRVENSPSGSMYFQYPVLRALDLDALLSRVDEETDGRSVERQLKRDRIVEAIGRFRAGVAREVGRRVADRKGPDHVARHTVRALPQDVDLLTAMSADISELRRAVRPLARKLAARVAMKRKRAHGGRLDVRRTVRHSLSTGGVLMDVHLRKRVPHRPELFILCDVSDSVARFARFSLMLVHALSAQFTKVRSFVFVDTIDEVTRLFDHEDFMTAVDRINDEADVVWLDRHSDYGVSLERFLERYGREITPRSTILILGDARNNNRISNAWVVKELRSRARKVYWLNPEARSFWDTGDSIASEYARYTDAMVEVRSVKQLERFIERIL